MIHIQYSIDIARKLTADDNICVSTDDVEIKKVVESSVYNVYFTLHLFISTQFNLNQTYFFLF